MSKATTKDPELLAALEPEYFQWHRECGCPDRAVTTMVRASASVHCDCGHPMRRGKRCTKVEGEPAGLFASRRGEPMVRRRGDLLKSDSKRPPWPPVTPGARRKMAETDELFARAFAILEDDRHENG